MAVQVMMGVEGEVAWANYVERQGDRNFSRADRDGNEGY